MDPLRWVFSSVISNLLSCTGDDEAKQHTADTQMTSIDLSKRVDLDAGSFEFQMPLHYPRYTKKDYESMEEWRLDLLLSEYGLSHFRTTGCSLEDERSFAIGAFLWPDQL